MADWSDKAEGIAVAVLGVVALGAAIIVVGGNGNTPPKPIIDATATPTAGASPAASPLIDPSAKDVGKSIQRLTELLRPGGSPSSLSPHTTTRARTQAASKPTRSTASAARTTRATASAQATRPTAAPAPSTHPVAEATRPTEDAQAHAGSVGSANSAAACPQTPASELPLGPYSPWVQLCAPAAPFIVGQRSTLSGALTAGQVVVPQAASVVLERLTSEGTWVYAGRTVASSGRFSFPVTLTTAGEHTFRAVTPPAGTFLGATSRPLTVLSGGGEGRGYTLLTPPVRWASCGEVGYLVNLGGVDPAVLEDVKEAARRISQATGIPLVYRGETPITPGAGEGSVDQLPAGAQIVIAWAKPGTTTHLTPGTGRVAQTRVYWEKKAVAAGGTPWHPLTQASVVLSNEVDIPRGFGTSTSRGTPGTWGQVLMHHLAHTMGVGHAPLGANSLMQETFTQRDATWEPGDLLGLRAVGRGTTCSHRPPVTLPPTNASGGVAAHLGVTTIH